MNKHDELIARLQDPMQFTWDMRIEASALLQLYGDALERLGDPYAFDDFSINERIDYAKQVVDDYEQ
jgi:hypothetical protein